MRNDANTAATLRQAGRRGLWRRPAAAVVTALLLAAPGPTRPAPPPASTQREADLLLIVDCLLPGQVRRLGQQTMYQSARRPARLPARDCQIRGGEYVAYDRADLQSALGAWQPLAATGDVEAQVIVGEIHERGLGVAPDYAAALAWYRRAADAGSRRAQVNLGYLYERGLGAPADAATALDWYRRAAGRDAVILLDPPQAAAATALAPPAAVAAPVATPVADPAELERLRARAAELEASLQRLGAELEVSRRQLGASPEALAATRRQLEATRQELEASRTRAAAAEAEAATARQRIASAETEAAAARLQSTAAADRAAQIAALQGELERRSGDAAMLARELAAARALNDRRLAALDEAGRESAAAQHATAAERARLTEAALRLTERERELARRREETDRLGRELAAAAALATESQARALRLGRELEQSQALASERQREAERLGRRLTEAESLASSRRQESERLARELAAANALAATRQQRIAELERPVAAGLLAGPEVAVVMPELTRTRDIVPVARVAAAEARLVGRVTAPAGLVALTVNDRPVAANELGVFSLAMPVGDADAPVTIVAVDRQGKRGEVRFLLRGPTTPAAPQTGPRAGGGRTLAASVDFGRYHALIIGNNDYRHLPDLGTPANDATELARLLEQRYGFRTTVLLNADRYQILTALNALRETLTAKDNLLVYYAGHGELDEANQRGHWLPVDAERDSTANWIPTDAVTDILNVLRAKQVLLIVDSCYAGALTRSSVARLGTGMTPEEQLHWFRTMANKRSRTVLTSGGIAPVMDAGGGRHSVFAKALLDVLAANGDALDGQRLHREVAARVAYAAANLRFDQVPEYAPIRHAGHEAGEFFLIPGS